MVIKTSENNIWKVTTFALVGTVIVISIVAAAIIYEYNITSSGIITPVTTVNCQVYADGAGNNPVTAIKWGTITPSSTNQISVNQTLWVKNTGNVPVNYTMYTTNWNPSTIHNYIDIKADFHGVTNATVGSILPFTLTLTVNASTPQGPFSNNVVIAASG
jgi:hypothetical protein